MFNSWFGYMWVWNTLFSTLADVLTRLTSLFFKKHYVLYVLLVLTCCPGRPCCPCSPGGPWAGKVKQRRHYVNFVHTLSYSNDFDFISGFLFFFTIFFPTMQSFFTRHIHCLKFTLNYFVKKLHCLQFFIPWRLCFSSHHFHKDHNAHCLPHKLSSFSRVRNIMTENLSIMLLSVILKTIALCLKLCSKISRLW